MGIAMSWNAVQLGSREHYAIPSALAAAGELDLLVTDSWIPAASEPIVRRLSKSLAGRRCSAIPDRLVRSRTLRRVLTDAVMKLGGISGWKAILQRNEWFQRWAAREVAGSDAPTVFSYSYTARLPFAAAKERGAKCILGQIDPGPLEVEVVRDKTAAYRDLASPEANPPEDYWKLWREESELADKIIVNSPWSAQLLVEEGVDAAKLLEIPLVYKLAESSGGSSQLADRNSLVTSHSQHVTGGSRRLRALFLGSVILRKGVGQLFDAVKMLKNEPVDLTFAGPIGVRIPDDLSRMPNVRFLGPVDRATTEHLYREADVFLFPTLSDGFGLTQLEALGHGLPVIASKNCGQVVEDRVNGLVLSEVTPQAIADVIMELVRDRDLLAKLKSNARVPDKCHPRHLAPALIALGK
jgi:glycosyltransferase involved in cell wall biosynthesis